MELFSIKIRCTFQLVSTLTIRSHDGILVLRLVVEVKSQLAKLCRFAIVLEIDVYRLLVLAFRSVV